MRALKRVLAIGALTAPLVIGCAGLASAHEGPHEGPGAHWSKSQFIANEEGAGFAEAFSFVGPDGVEHGKRWIWADDHGVSGSFIESGAHF
ncbi:hypothetical protein ACFYS8_35300 [Kitasatospora sp. NPDC004615]|uniref:hypothetical protein n=1 Tax=unclassified Kitasatospora TaxID=2633591 RepID=UPI00368DAD34